MSITSDYLQLYPEDFEGKASNSTLRAMFIQGETSMSVFNFENVPRGLCPYQKGPNVGARDLMYIPECVHFLIYVRWSYDDTSHHRQRAVTQSQIQVLKGLLMASSNM